MVTEETTQINETSMKHIRYARLYLAGSLNACDIPQFRMQLKRKIEEHDGYIKFWKDNAHRLKRNYPILQYKCVKNRPTIIALEDGIDLLLFLLTQLPFSIEVGDHKMEVKVEEVYLKHHLLNVWDDRKWRYTLRCWLALNDENHVKYNGGTEEQRKTLLERILTGNILSFAKGLNWFVDKQLDVNIDEIENVREITFKGDPTLSFNVVFTANVFLPDYISLGKGAAIGYGTIKRIEELTEEKQE